MGTLTEVQEIGQGLVDEVILVLGFRHIKVRKPNV